MEALRRAVVDPLIPGDEPQFVAAQVSKRFEMVCSIQSPPDRTSKSRPTWVQPPTARPCVSPPQMQTHVNTESGDADRHCVVHRAVSGRNRRVIRALRLSAVARSKTRWAALCGIVHTPSSGTHLGRRVSTASCSHCLLSARKLIRTVAGPLMGTVMSMCGRLMLCTPERRRGSYSAFWRSCCRGSTLASQVRRRTARVRRNALTSARRPRTHPRASDAPRARLRPQRADRARPPYGDKRLRPRRCGAASDCNRMASCERVPPIPSAGSFAQGRRNRGPWQ